MSIQPADVLGQPTEDDTSWVVSETATTFTSSAPKTLAGRSKALKSGVIRSMASRCQSCSHSGQL